MYLEATLKNMTVADLRKLAARFDITGRSTMKKAELVRELTDPDIADVVELSITVDEIDETAVVDAATAEHENEEIDLTSTIDNVISGWLPAEVTEQPDRAAYYSGTVPCFERTTVDGIGYGCVKLGEHVEHNTALGAAWWTPAERVAITKYSAHEAFATAVFNGESVGSHIMKVRGRWALQYGSGHVIRAKTLGKVAKRWAKALGFHATAIDIDAMN